MDADMRRNLIGLMPQRIAAGARVGSRPDIVPNVGGIYSCPCPALRNKLPAAVPPLELGFLANR